ncbi:MAG TPA: hypothetical protein VJB82_04870 [Candidatus Peribacterales bacterium]|nr:hypothetical protein [Candidatus Peribacterales bacterium]
MDQKYIDSYGKIIASAEGVYNAACDLEDTAVSQEILYFLHVLVSLMIFVRAKSSIEDPSIEKVAVALGMDNNNNPYDAILTELRDSHVCPTGDIDEEYLQKLRALTLCERYGNYCREIFGLEPDMQFEHAADFQRLFDECIDTQISEIGKKIIDSQGNYADYLRY